MYVWLCTAVALQLFIAFNVFKSKLLAPCTVLLCFSSPDSRQLSSFRSKSWKLWVQWRPSTETGLKKGGKERSFFLILLQISASWKSSREEICGNKITQSHCPAQTGERRLQSVQDLSPAHVCRLDVCICKTLAEPLLDRSNIFQPNNDPFATPGYSQTSRCRNMLDLIGLVMFFRETTHLYSRQWISIDWDFTWLFNVAGFVWVFVLNLLQCHNAA